jgi:hypothetical protein
LSVRPPPSVLPDISPTRGEIGKTLYRHFNLNVEMGETSPRVDLPLVGEMSGRTEGGGRALCALRYPHHR